MPQTICCGLLDLEAFELFQVQIPFTILWLYPQRDSPRSETPSKYLLRKLLNQLQTWHSYSHTTCTLPPGFLMKKYANLRAQLPVEGWWFVSHD